MNIRPVAHTHTRTHTHTPETFLGQAWLRVFPTGLDQPGQPIVGSQYSAVSAGRVACSRSHSSADPHVRSRRQSLQWNIGSRIRVPKQILALNLRSHSISTFNRKIYDLVLFRNHSENSMTHISVMTHFLVRRVMCRIQLRITHPVFGWWGLLIYSSVYDDALPLCAPHLCGVKLLALAVCVRWVL
jgi:hypothetical protein